MYFPKSFIISITLIIFALVFSKTSDGTRYRFIRSSRIGISQIIFNCIIVLCGILLSLSRSAEQDSVLSGLVYGGYVVFPENNLTYLSLTLPNLSTAISSLWLSNTAAVGMTNYLLTFIGFLLFLYAYFLILRKFLGDRPELILIAIVLTLWNPVYDYFSTAYPAVLPGASTTFGLFGIGLAFITISNLLAHNHSSAGFYFGLLLATHLTFFLITIFLASFYLLLQLGFSKDLLPVKRFLMGFFPTILVSVPLYFSSFTKVLETKTSSSEIRLFKAYLANLDVHRNPNFDFPRSILLANMTIMLIIIFLLVHRNFQGISNGNREILVFLFIFSGITSVFYLAQIKASENLSTGFLNTYMLWRVTNLFGLVLSPFIIIALVLTIRYTLEKLHFNFELFDSLTHLSKIFILIAFLLLTRVELLGGLEALSTAKLKSHSYQNTHDCLSSSKLKVALTAPSLSRVIISNCRQPILLASTLDNIPYERTRLNLYHAILSEVYNVNIENPPNYLLHTATLVDKNLEALWVNRMPESWTRLSSQFGFQEVIVPRTWKDLTLCKVKNHSELSMFVRYSTKSTC